MIVLSFASLGRVEDCKGIVEGCDVADVWAQSSVSHSLDDFTQLGRALAERVGDALRWHRVRQDEQRLKMGAHWEDGDLVFTNEIGRPVEVSNLTHRYFRPLLKKLACLRSIP